MARTNTRTNDANGNELQPTNPEFGSEDYISETQPTDTPTGSAAGGTAGGSGEEELTPPKRRRGRPQGSTNSSKKEKVSIGFQESEKVNGKAKYSSTKNTVQFMTKEEAEQTTAFILSTVNDLAVTFIGKEAAMNMLETSLLALSLPNYLSTLQMGTIEKTSKLLYPLMGLLGVSIYGFRVGGIILEKTEQTKETSQPFTENNNYPHVEKVEVYDSPINPETQSNINNGEQINWNKGKINLQNAQHLL